MAKAYWVTTYRAVLNPERVAAYAALALPAIQAGGGRFLARGMPTAVEELGMMERTVLVEFDTLAEALAVYDSPGYQEALAALGPDSVQREIRIIEGMG